jgi:predicted transcriptional regulator
MCHELSSMPGDAAPRPEDVLEDVAYLSRSATRTRVVDALAAAPYTPRSLAQHTDIPRSTLRRTLTEMVERGWVERTLDGEYVLTATGERVAAETDRYLESMRAIRTLGDAVAWLPSDELTVDLRHFADATVRRPEPNATSAPSTVVTERLRDATEFACLVNVAPSLGFERVMIDGVVEGRLTTTHVITDAELDVLRRDPDRAARWRTYVEAGADLSCYDGRIPCNLLVIDETVFLLDRRPEAPEGIECTTPAVREWATDLIDDYRDAAEPLDATAFDP